MSNLFTNNDEKQECCKNCAYSIPYNDVSNTLKCHCNPPRINSNGSDIGPIVKEDDWCSEWEDEEYD